tara:strand:+ start:380 stop:787 length:408 start_codon:yes stop_codon:yes gene_type:complete
MLNFSQLGKRYLAKLTTKERIKNYNVRFTVRGVTRSQPSLIDKDYDWMQVPVIFQCIHDNRGEGEFISRIYREPADKMEVEKYNRENVMYVHEGKHFQDWGDKSFKASSLSIFDEEIEHKIKYSDIQIIENITRV